MKLSLDLTSLRAAYKSGNFTPTQLIDDILGRIAQHADPAAWIHLLTRDALLEHVRRIEARGVAALPLYGVPFAIKDNIDLAGVPTTAACPEFAYTPTASAPVVQRLLDAGAIPLGKTNLDQFATGLVGVRSPYGVPRNPFRADTIPGGSSSGSAVTVAAGLVSFSLGTDTAGSGRVPAGLNNLVGLKPTKGALSTRGLVAACRSLDCVSVFALTCSDATAILRVMEGADADDAFSRERPGPATGVRKSAGPAALRIGVPAASELQFCGDAEAERLFHASLARIEALGAKRVEIDYAPFREAAALLYQGPWVAERWAALRAFHTQHAAAFFLVTRRIVEGASSLTAVDAFEGMYLLAALQKRASGEWEKMDVLLVPTAPRPYTIAEIEADPIALNSRLGTYTNFVNLLDLSALAVPAGMRSDRLPWGVTFIAPAWHESELLQLGSRWHADVGGKLGATGTPLPHALAESPAVSTPPAPVHVRLTVVGAHLTGLPLNGQLTERGATLLWSGETTPSYRLFALPGTNPPKPGLLRVAEGGVAVAVEVWSMSETAFGSFVAAVPPPLCIGTIALSSGESAKGFLCEPAGLGGAEDISRFGGWRAYLQSRKV